MKNEDENLEAIENTVLTVPDLNEVIKVMFGFSFLDEPEEDDKRDNNLTGSK